MQGHISKIVGGQRLVTQSPHYDYVEIKGLNNMIKIRDRAVRLVAALMLATLIASQIPVTGTVALAQNGYDFSEESDDTPNKIIVGVCWS